MYFIPNNSYKSIRHGRYGAVVTEMGATLRSVTVDDRELLWTFPADGVEAHSQGRQLIPWPNRIADGTYTFDGHRYQLDISEVDKNNAIHGLNLGRGWELLAHEPNSVTLGHTFFPEHGWPGVLEVRITFVLSDDGLRVEVDATNAGTVDLPFGYGVHPYFEFGDLSDVVLKLPFARELKVDRDRLLPITIQEVPAGDDFRAPRPLGHAAFDTAFCSPEEMPWTVELRGPDHGVAVWGETPWAQVFTTRPKRHAIAVEVMTCGPDAFNEGSTHADMIRLTPGQSTSVAWGIRAL